MKIMIEDYECAFITLHSEMRRITPVLQAIDRGENYSDIRNRVKYSRKRKIQLPPRTTANWECDCGAKGRGSCCVKNAVRSLKRHKDVFHPEWGMERGYIIEVKEGEVR